MVYTYLHPTIFFPFGISHLSHVSFLSRAEISSSIAFFQFGSRRASSTVRGTSLEWREVLKATTVCERFSLLSLFTGYLDLCVSYSGSYLLGGIPLVLLGGNSYLSGTLTLTLTTLSWLLETVWGTSEFTSSGSGCSSDRTGVG